MLSYELDFSISNYLCWEAAFWKPGPYSPCPNLDTWSAKVRYVVTFCSFTVKEKEVSLAILWRSLTYIFHERCLPFHWPERRIRTLTVSISWIQIIIWEAILKISFSPSAAALHVKVGGMKTDYSSPSVPYQSLIPSIFLYPGSEILHLLPVFSFSFTYLKALFLPANKKNN